jgi:glycosyltransferase involved in cell wall biosynthesis
VHYHPYRYSPRRSWTPWGFSESLEDGVRIRKPLYALAPLVLGSATRTGRKLLASRSFDVVHSHWVIPNGPIGALIAQGGVPLVVSLHGSDLAVAERSRAAKRAALWTLARAAVVTAPSKDLLGRAAPMGAAGLQLIPYGADVDEFETTAAESAAARNRLGLAADDVVVMGIGRLIAVKGFDVLVEAHALAVRECPELRLVLVGDGDQAVALRHRAVELGLAGSVLFTGPATRAEIPALLASADIVAVPSVRHRGYVDGLPNVALEAMAASRPLVASRVGGLPDLVRPDENGLLVDERDPRQLADAIMRLAGQPALRERLGRFAHEEIRLRRSWSAAAHQLVQVYEQAVQPC